MSVGVRPLALLNRAGRIPRVSLLHGYQSVSILLSPEAQQSVPRGAAVGGPLRNCGSRECGREREIARFEVLLGCAESLQRPGVDWNFQ